VDDTVTHFYRPYDYLPPSTVKDKCTHTKANGRNVVNQNKCLAHDDDVVACDGDYDCTFIPLDMVVIKTEYKCTSGGGSYWVITE
jgi:hypothetical protein